MSRIKPTTEDFINKMQEINPDIEIIGKYIDAHTAIQCKCRIDGYEWEATPTSLTDAKTGCPKCRGGIKLTNEEFLLKLSIANPKIMAIEKYTSTHTKMKFQCSIDGYIWSAMPSNVLRGKGCPKCGRKIIEKATRKTRKQFINDIKQINPDLEILSKYTNAHSYVLCRCKKHDFTWNVMADHLARGCGCPVCRTSKGEKEISNILRQSNIRYVYQKKFISCKNKINLLFDFYLPDANTCIEYDGEQHYRPNNYFGGEDKFLKLKECDKIKNQFCQENNINLIRIPYTVTNIEQYLNERLLA